MDMDSGRSTTQNLDSLMTGMVLGNSERGNGTSCNTNATNRRSVIRKRRSKHGGGTRKQRGGRFGGRRQRRLWQLPKSSIDEYTKWIQEKPEEDQTPNEQRFLWKCMIRSLGVVNNTGVTDKSGKRSRQERIREFVDRLEAKNPMELTQNEQQFVRLYHKRRRDRKAQKQQRKQQQQEGDQTISWMRTDDNTAISSENNQGNRKNNHMKNKGFEPSASLESLRESMNRMGLSSDKLKQVRFADQKI